MFKAIKKIGKEKAVFKLTFEPLSLVVSCNKPINIVLVFSRGDAKPDQTKTF
jgi:hypothetical protein